MYTFRTDVFSTHDDIFVFSIIRTRWINKDTESLFVLRFSFRFVFACGCVFYELLFPVGSFLNAAESLFYNNNM